MSIIYFFRHLGSICAVIGQNEIVYKRDLGFVLLFCISEHLIETVVEINNINIVKGVVKRHYYAAVYTVNNGVELF